MKNKVKKSAFKYPSTVSFTKSLLKYFSLEISNVQDKRLSLLVYYFICVCYSKQKRILKVKFQLFLKKSCFFNSLFLDFDLVTKIESLLNNLKNFILVCFHLDIATNCNKIL